jgi:flagellar motor switch protein FliN
VLAKAGVQSPQVESLDAKTCTEALTQMAEKQFRTTLKGGGRARGILTLIASEEDGLQLGQAFIAEPVNRGGQFVDTYRKSAAELISQAAEDTATTWGTRTGVKLEFVVAQSGAAEPEAICGGLRLSGEKFTPVTIIVAPSVEFAESLRALGGAPTPVATPASGRVAAQPAGGNDAAPGFNLDLLYDVQLEATIRFGERQLLLRDILAMTPGSVIELDRRIQEPAELLVAGRLVARGEVVVVDGSFGLRITELSSPRQRAELLKG